MTTYKVELRGRSHYVIGLRPEYDEYGDKDTMLIYRYAAGDIDTRMREAHMMLGALYDLFQTHDLLKEGDKFDTEFGEYECVGVHVVPNFDMGPEPERLKRQHNTEW